MKRILMILLAGLLAPAFCAGAMLPEANPDGAAVATENAAAGEGAPAAKSFDGLADAALVAMKQRADELKVGGVAVVAYFQGDTIQSWTSKMAVVGRHRDEPSNGNNGTNLVAIAYSKAAEMADTLKDSGSKVRPPMQGEFGWSGGVIVRGKNGYIIAAFSGGKSEDDVEVSKAGLAKLVVGL